MELREEAGIAEDERGKLLFWLYGCRRAGRAWEDHFSEVLVHAGFCRAMSSPVDFYHTCRDLWAVVHGDDFVFTALDGDLDFVLQVLTQHYEIDILGRAVRLHRWGVSW